jgi:aminopeptidase N
MESYNDYNKKDHCSLSNIDVFVCQHIHVDWEIDFKKTIFRGSARHSIKVIKEGCNVLEMDSSDIQIKSVQVNNKKADFSIGDTIPGLGQKVSVTLPEETEISFKTLKFKFLK